MRRGLLALLLLFSLAWAATPENPFARRVYYAWKLVKDLYYDPGYHGVDWEAVGRRYLKKAEGLKDWDATFALVREMYAELGDAHSTYLDPERARVLAGAACYRVPYPEVWKHPPRIKPDEASSPAGGDGGAWGGASARMVRGFLVLRLPDLVEAENYGKIAAGLRAHPEARGVVLDLRGNPGGLVFEMARTAALFVRGWPWRLVQRGLGAVPLPTLPFWGEPEIADRPLAVLVDGGVNSAAEGLAGALKNAGRAKVIGEATAGNTEAIVPYCFPEGSMALIAVGVLAPLKGPTWEGRGVVPDLEADPEEALNAALRYLETATQGKGKGSR